MGTLSAGPQPLTATWSRASLPITCRVTILLTRAHRPFFTTRKPWILARAPELRLHQIRYLSWFWQIARQSNLPLDCGDIGNVHESYPPCDFSATGPWRLCPFSTPYKGVFLPRRLMMPQLRKHKTQNKFRWTPRHNYPKSLLQQTFCSTHEHEPTKEDGCLSVFKYMLLLALLVVVLSSCDTSEPSYTKQSFMNAKEHSNTETLFQRNAEAFS